MRLLKRDRQIAQVVAIKCQDVEGIQLHLGIQLARVQRIEVRIAVHTENDGFAIDDELFLPVPQSGFGYPRVSLGPVMAVPSEQPDTIAVAVDDQAITVVLHLVKPIWADRDLPLPISSS
jgi:hypothetical protein